MRPLRLHARAAAPTGREAVRLWRLCRDLAGPDSLRTAATLLAPYLASDLRMSDAIRLRYDGRGRPSLPDHAHHDLSISHAGGCWMLALACGRRRIGLDIEPLRALPNALAYARTQFPAREAALLAKLSPAHRSRAFLRLWCAREAMSKAIGEGLGAGFDAVEFDFDHAKLVLRDCHVKFGRPSDWHLREFTPTRGMVGCVAWRGPRAVLRGVHHTRIVSLPADPAV